MEVTKRQWQVLLALKLATYSGGFASVKEVNKFLDKTASTASGLENLVYNDRLVQVQASTSLQNRPMNRYKLTRDGHTLVYKKMRDIIGFWKLKEKIAQNLEEYV
jgi:predicted ArsR family transcriptional regulator